MRVVFALALVAACASAATLLDHPNAAAVQQSGFGSSVLAELQSKLATGTPLDELKSILDDIRKRLSDAAAADAAAQEADDEFCQKENSTLNSDITTQKNFIDKCTLEIAKEQAIIDQAIADIAEMDRLIAIDKKEIADNEAAQKAATEQRELEYETWVNNTRDSNLCIEAINEIKMTDNFSTLVANQDDDASDYLEGVTALLQKVSSKVSDERVTSLMAIAALSAATLDKGDMDKLVELLDKLKAELQEYIVDLKNDEDELKRQYDAYMAQMAIQLKTHQDSLAEHIDMKEGYLVTKAGATSRRDDWQIKKNDAQDTLADLEANQRLLTQGCVERRAAHENRKDERIQENDVLDQIEKILEEKLSHHFTDHIQDRTKDVTVRG